MSGTLETYSKLSETHIQYTCHFPESARRLAVVRASGTNDYETYETSVLSLSTTILNECSMWVHMVGPWNLLTRQLPCPYGLLSVLGSSSADCHAGLEPVREY